MFLLFFGLKAHSQGPNLGPKFRPISDFLQAQQANKPAKPKATAPVFYHAKALVGQPTRTPSSPRSCLAQLRAGSRPALHARLHRSDSTPARVSRLQLLRFCTSMLVTHQLTSPLTRTPPHELALQLHPEAPYPRLQASHDHSSLLQTAPPANNHAQVCSPLHTADAKVASTSPLRHATKKPATCMPTNPLQFSPTLTPCIAHADLMQHASHFAAENSAESQDTWSWRHGLGKRQRSSAMNQDKKEEPKVQKEVHVEAERGFFSVY